MTMSRATSQDNLVVYSASIVVIALVIVLGTSWYFMKTSEKKSAEVAYATFGPLNLQRHGFAVRTSIAIQTRSGNSAWTTRNRSRLDAVFQKVLADTDPDAIRTSDGLQNLQIVLRDAANAALDTNNVEAVYLTDFLQIRDDG